MIFYLPCNFLPDLALLAERNDNALLTIISISKRSRGTCRAMNAPNPLSSHPQRDAGDLPSALIFHSCMIRSPVCYQKRRIIIHSEFKTRLAVRYAWQQVDRQEVDVEGRGEKGTEGKGREGVSFPSD